MTIQLTEQQWAAAQGSSETILVSISRSTHRASATQLFIDLATPAGAATGLRQNSMIQCENLLTHDQRLILTKIGALPPALMRQIDGCLKAVLGLS
jgi:mRNA-degrading endonuclease toxin of MazEF toxin-antitoxin module